MIKKISRPFRMVLEAGKTKVELDDRYLGTKNKIQDNKKRGKAKMKIMNLSKTIAIKLTEEKIMDGAIKKITNREIRKVLGGEIRKINQTNGKKIRKTKLKKIMKFFNLQQVI